MGGDCCRLTAGYFVAKRSGGVIDIFIEWLRAVGRWENVCKKYRRRIENAEHSLSLAEMERDSLARQLEAATDTLQAFGLHNRAIGAEAKVYLGQIVAATKP